MIRMTALRTAEAFTPARLRVDVTTPIAFLRAVRSAFKLDRSTGPVLLVTEHVLEAGPSSVRDPKRAISTHHPLDVQLLQHDDAVALGISCGLIVMEMGALSSGLAVLPHDSTFGFFTILGSFLSTGNCPLSVSKLFQRSFQVLRVGDQLPVRGSCEVDDAAIDRDHGTGSWDRIRDLDLADDRHEPLIPITNERAALRSAFERAMDDQADLSELGKLQCRSDEAPGFRMRLTQINDVNTLSFPARGIRELLETALPGFVEVMKQLHRYVTRNVCKPRQLGSKLGQIFRLIKCGYITPLATSACESKQSLFIRKVPEEPQSITPAIRHRDLFPRRVGAEAKGLTDQHSGLSSTAVRQPTPRDFLPALNDGASALETM